MNRACQITRQYLNRFFFFLVIIIFFKATCRCWSSFRRPVVSFFPFLLLFKVGYTFFFLSFFPMTVCLNQLKSPPFASSCMHRSPSFLLWISLFHGRSEGADPGISAVIIQGHVSGIRTAVFSQLKIEIPWTNARPLCNTLSLWLTRPAVSKPTGTHTRVRRWAITTHTTLLR